MESWQTGRKPSGLWGAAVYVSALAHGLKCSKSDIVSNLTHWGIFFFFMSTKKLNFAVIFLLTDSSHFGFYISHKYVIQLQ